MTEGDEKHSLNPLAVGIRHGSVWSHCGIINHLSGNRSPGLTLEVAVQTRVHSSRLYERVAREARHAVLGMSYPDHVGGLPH